MVKTKLPINWNHWGQICLCTIAGTNDMESTVIWDDKVIDKAQWGKVDEKDTQITNIIFPIQFKSKLLIGLTTDIATSVPNIVVQSINTNYTNKNMEILHANISDAFFFMVLGI